MYTLEKVRVQISQIDGTRKYLFRLADGNVIESVLMRYQAWKFRLYFLAGGVPDGLPFLCFDPGRLERNLRPSEMLDQIYQIQRDHRRTRFQRGCDGNRVNRWTITIT